MRLFLLLAMMIGENAFSLSYVFRTDGSPFCEAVESDQDIRRATESCEKNTDDEFEIRYCQNYVVILSPTNDGCLKATAKFYVNTKKLSHYAKFFILDDNLCRPSPVFENARDNLQTKKYCKTVQKESMEYFECSRSDKEKNPKMVLAFHTDEDCQKIRERINKSAEKALSTPPRR